MRTLTEAPETHVPAEVEGAPEPAADVLSVIVPVLREHADLAGAYWAYKEALAGRGVLVEFIYVLSRQTPNALAVLARLKDAGEALTTVVLSRCDDEGAALRSGFHQARGATIMTLPAFLQVDPADLPDVLAGLDCDMVVGRRTLRAGSLLDTIQATVFHWLIRTLFGHAFSDLVCRVRVSRRQVLEEVNDYGMQHHFLPLLASDRGFRIREVEVREGRTPTPTPDTSVLGRLDLPGRIRLTLDILAFYVLLKFVRKPLRFFGAIGLPIFAVGFLYTAGLAFARLFFGVPLGDRPALILGALLIVLGIQIVALGLIGEIIIFASGKRIKDYVVEKIV